MYVILAYSYRTSTPLLTILLKSDTLKVASNLGGIGVPTANSREERILDSMGFAD
jgi:hypothetical protein